MQIKVNKVRSQYRQVRLVGFWCISNQYEGVCSDTSSCFYK